MLQQEEHEVYEPYVYSTQDVVSELKNVDESLMAQASEAQSVAKPTENTWEPEALPPLPPLSSRPWKRSGCGGAITLLTLLLLLIFGIGLFSGWEFTANRSSATAKVGTTTVTTYQASAVKTQQELAIAKIEPAVVELQVTTAQGQQIGSGVILDTKGDIVTNEHVVNNAQTITAVLSNGNTEVAQLIGTVTADDLAVVRIAPFAHMTVAQLGNSSQLIVGQEVLAVGNPLGITETATRGIVSALNRSVTESTGTVIAHAIQTDAAVNPGNSGGALVNMQGELIGIPTLTAINTEFNTTANGLSFAIPANLVETAVQQMLQQAGA